MKRLYSWLQEEVNENINDYLLTFSLSKVKNQDEAIAIVNKTCDELLKKYLNLEQILIDNKIEVKVMSLPNNYHASYDPNNRKIYIDDQWLDFLRKHVGKQKAYNFCISHELVHVIINRDDLVKVKRRHRKYVEEAIAIMFSQKFNNVEYHPYLYEYYYSIDNGNYNEADLIRYLKGEN